MVRIETYKGSTEELVDFVNRVWDCSYSGKMTFPRWTEKYFAWQFRLDHEGSRRNLIAAYDGPVLAGVLLGTSYPCRSPAGLHLGSQWSWLSIHPDYQNRGIAKALHQERMARQAADHSRLIVSFRYVGSPHSMAERPQKQSQDRKFNRKIGFWARVLDPVRFAQWHWSRVEGLLAKAIWPFMQIPKSARSDVSIRPFAIGDLDACLHLIRENCSRLCLTLAWDHDSLLHQLSGNDISQTLVVEENGCVTGFVNFHLLKFHARTIEPVGIFDLIVLGKASSRSRVRLLNAALVRMQDQGAVLALKVRCGDTPNWPMLRTHFIPERPDSFLVLQSVGEEMEIPKTSSIHVLWR